MSDTVSTTELMGLVDDVNCLLPLEYRVVVVYSDYSNFCVRVELHYKHRKIAVHNEILTMPYKRNAALYILQSVCEAVDYHQQRRE